MMKREYISPEVVITSLSQTDVITLSGVDTATKSTIQKKKLTGLNSWYTLIFKTKSADKKLTTEDREFFIGETGNIQDIQKGNVKNTFPSCK